MLSAALLEPLADLVLPRRCVGCGAPGVALCSRCSGGPVRRVDVASLPVWAAAGYGGGMRRALIHYKERGRRDLALPLGRLLALAVAAALAAGDPRVLLVPVPSARAAAAARGGDHAARLARRAALLAGVRPAPGVLRLTRAVQDSAGLTAHERARNVAMAMAARAGPGRRAILVDDVVTTGATLREAVRALVAAGWSVPAAAVVAATPGPSGGRPARLAGVVRPIGSTWPDGLAS